MRCAVCGSADADKDCCVNEWRDKGACVVLVAGPPCAGKTSYVKRHAGPSDIVVDFDSFVEEVGAHRYDRRPWILDRARRRWFDALDMVRTLERDKTAWVIWTAASGFERRRFCYRYDARCVVVLPTKEECLARAAEERPPVWQRYIRSWFLNYSPNEGETVVA